MGTFVTRQRLVWLAGAGSLGLLLSAWFFEFVLGYAPCTLCYWQRWPHMAAVALAVLAAAPLPPLAGAAAALAGAGAAATSAGIGLYHSGVERGLWDGPAACSVRSEDLGALSGADLLNPETAAPLIRCDEIPWQMLGLTMANLNVVASLAIAALWVWAAWRALWPADRQPRTA